MHDSAGASGFRLICVIVNFGLGSKIVHTAKQYGIRGGTILLGKGTANHPVLNFLALNDVRKEIVLMGADKETADYVLYMLAKTFQFEKPNHGIAFSSDVCGITGASCYQCDGNMKRTGVDSSMYQSITVIVNKGLAEQVVDAAAKAGSNGGTIINARGSGVHETSKIFSMDIEPEREIVMILADCGKTEAIINSIRKELDIDKPGKGIIFTQNIGQTYGLYE